MELFTLLPGVGPGNEPGGGPGGGDCAPPGPLSLPLKPLAVGIDEAVAVPPDVCVSRVAGGRGLCACFFLPKRNDMMSLQRPVDKALYDQANQGFRVMKLEE